VNATYFRKISGLVVVYDVTSLKSLNSVNRWITLVKEHGPEGVPIIVFGNKCDMNHTVTLTDVSAALGEIECREVSAMTGENLDSAFGEFMVRVRDFKPKTMDMGRSPTVSLKNTQRPLKKSGCCKAT
jgi:small GTP-binding protein